MSERATAALEGIVDQVRTTLSELIAEMRSGTPSEVEIPTQAVADGAVSFAVYGDQSTVVMAGTNATVGLPAPITIGGWWTRSRMIGAAVAGVASIGGLVLAIGQWRGWL